MQDYFYKLADQIGALLQAGEVYTLSLVGEDSDFVRFNRNRVRQAGFVRQLEIVLDLIEGARHAAAQFSVSGELAHDLALVRAQLERLRTVRAHLADDPYLLYATELRNSEDVRTNQLPDPGEAVAGIVAAADGLDLVGYLASGAQYEGFANSLGQRNWFASASFNLDWSCHLAADKAVKSSYAGFEWRPEELRQRVASARAQLEILARPSMTLKPGRYRAYFAPAALHEIFDTVAEGGFGLKQQRTMQSPLLKLARGERALHAQVTLVENNRAGLAPLFTPGGFVKPARVELVRQGLYAGCLAAPRSAREYGVAVNAASERPGSLDMAGGQLAAADVLTRLDTGLYVNNLWYSNFSDRSDCRLTGMTRYACFWVEGGEIQGPVEVMRFDDSVYRMLGENLIDLTREREFRFDANTYHRRSTASMHLPGALIEDFNLTL
jgi:predicted Zn-dependent protease